MKPTLPGTVWAALAAALCALLVLGGLALYKSGRVQSPAAVPGELVIAYRPGVYSAFLSIAEDRGFFHDVGLAVRLKSSATGFDALETLVRGEAEVATSSEYPIVSMLAEHQDLRIVATIATANSTEIVARRDRVTAPGELRGKTIGVVPNTASEYYLMVFLVANGMATTDVTVREYHAGELPGGLERGEVDAISAWDIFAEQAKDRLKGQAVSWPAQNSQEFFWCLVTRQDTVQRKPEEIRRLLRAMLRAETYVRARESTAKEIVASRAGVDRKLLETVWSRTSLDLSLDQALIVSMENAAIWRMRGRNVESRDIPNFLRNIYIDALADTDSSAVTVYR